MGMIGATNTASALPKRRRRRMNNAPTGSSQIPLNSGGGSQMPLLNTGGAGAYDPLAYKRWLLTQQYATGTNNTPSELGATSLSSLIYGL